MIYYEVLLLAPIIWLALHNSYLFIFRTGDISTRRLKLWEECFEELLVDPLGRETLQKFLDKEYSGENLRFWWEVGQFDIGTLRAYAIMCLRCKSCASAAVEWCACSWLRSTTSSSTPMQPPRPSMSTARSWKSLKRISRTRIDGVLTRLR